MVGFSYLSIRHGARLKDLKLSSGSNVPLVHETSHLLGASSGLQFFDALVDASKS